MIEKYKTIGKSGYGEYKEKGSKFYGFAVHVSNDEDVKIELDELRKKFHDARHHCYAFILNPESDHYRAADDGEPAHSAGDPILGQIRSAELTNCLIVVVRYFGGTKLGVGGLIHAYKTAAAEALSNAKVIEKTVRKHFTIQYGYAETNEIMRLVNDLDIKINDQDYEEECLLKGAIAIGQVNQLRDKIELLQNLGNNVTLDIL